ncbi:M20 family peptidase [Aquabacterium sp. CECT 9606]|uniref:M20 family peptidase n=1 Tax=Aquabacterium sp. CECT 9606 TaxID=2845822 RepID=UPI001E5A3D9B|nr:M20 family peptidase [Aquabacterium sp. CECT 9606]CAH0350740.1 Succinyl-diaminopimelate desuccinylase [Aquabacterium sp. CECT 9606]
MADDTHSHKTSLIKRTLWLVAGLLLGLAVILAWQTWRFPSRQIQVEPRSGVAVDAAAAAGRLSAAVQLRTVWSATDANAASFEALRQLIQTSYPNAHATLTRQVIGQHALLYTWPGTDPQAKPIALLAHQDVVSVAPGTDKDWQVPPFSGTIQDGFVWGRGAWDDKSSVMAILEAVESLVKAGFKPRQTIYLLFNADEEVGGDEGAAQVAKLWRQQGIKLDFLLDEGLVITHGLVPGVKAPVALVGLSQKGYLTLKLTAKGQPGHSSQPPKRHAIGVLAEALQRLEAHPLPGRLEGLPREMMESVAAEASGPMRVVLSNLWLTRPLVERELAKTPAADAMLRTTAVPTILNAGELENVVPGLASATINYRLLPGNTSQDVIQHVQQVVEGLNVSVERQPKGAEAAPVSSTDSKAYRALARSLRELQPGTVVAPGLLIGGTDSIHFADLAETILRFRPIHATAQDLPRLHGTNERIGVAQYAEMIQFYERLLRNVNKR